MRHSFSGVVAAILLIVYPVITQAHDYWFESIGEGDYLLYRGHRFSQHGGDKVVACDLLLLWLPSCLKSGTDSDSPQSTAFSTQYPARITGPCQAILVTADSGYWSQTFTGTKNQPRDSLTGVLRSWHALETIKRVEFWSDRLLEPLSSELELVFTENPFTLPSGSKLRLIAMLDGKPIQGVSVAYDGKPRGITGDDGRINLRIRHEGLQVIAASLERPLNNNKKADKQVRSTILMFELKQ
jgi:nickel transport protein